MKDNDLALVWLRGELEYAADKGDVIKLNDVWDRYTTLAEKAEITIPPSFISRRATFKDKLMHMVGDIVECVQSLDRGPSERHNLLIPKKCVNMALSQMGKSESRRRIERSASLSPTRWRYISVACSCCAEDTR